jgi:hypothetical protein
MGAKAVEIMLCEILIILQMIQANQKVAQIHDRLNETRDGNNRLSLETVRRLTAQLTKKERVRVLANIHWENSLIALYAVDKELAESSDDWQSDPALRKAAKQYPKEQSKYELKTFELHLQDQTESINPERDELLGRSGEQENTFPFGSTEPHFREEDPEDSEPVDGASFEPAIESSTIYKESDATSESSYLVQQSSSRPDETRNGDDSSTINNDNTMAVASIPWFHETTERPVADRTSVFPSSMVGIFVSIQGQRGGYGTGNNTVTSREEMISTNLLSTDVLSTDGTPHGPDHAERNYHNSRDQTTPASASSFIGNVASKSSSLEATRLQTKKASETSETSSGKGNNLNSFHPMKSCDEEPDLQCESSPHSGNLWAPQSEPAKSHNGLDNFSDLRRDLSKGSVGKSSAGQPSNIPSSIRLGRDQGASHWAKNNRSICGRDNGSTKKPGMMPPKHSYSDRQDDDTVLKDQVIQGNQKHAAKPPLSSISCGSGTEESNKQNPTVSSSSIANHATFRQVEKQTENAKKDIISAQKSPPKLSAPLSKDKANATPITKRKLCFVRQMNQKGIATNVNLYINIDDSNSNDTIRSLYQNMKLKDHLHVLRVNKGRKARIEKNELLRFFHNTSGHNGETAEPEFLQYTIKDICDRDESMTIVFEVKFQEVCDCSESE